VFKHHDMKTYGRRDVKLHTQFLIYTHDREQLNFNMRKDFQCPLPNGAQIRSKPDDGEEEKKTAATGSYLLRSHVTEDYNTTPIRWSAAY